MIYGGVDILQRKLLIVGAGDFADLWVYYIRQYFKEYTIAACSVDQKYIRQDFWNGIPVIPFEQIEVKCPPAEYDVVVAIGYKQMNNIRKEKLLWCINAGYHLPNFIHPSAWIEADAVMGQGNLILEHAVLAHGVSIGHGNIIWNAVHLSHETKMENFNYLAPGTILAGKSEIGSNCFFGIGSSIRGKRYIADYTVVGAGAYINEKTEKCGVYLPARTKLLPQKKSADLPFQK